MILRTLEKSFSYLFMTRRLQALWARKGRVEIWDIGAGHYVARFEDDADYTRAMFEGPWLVGDHYVISEEWRPNFEPGFSQVNTVKIWVRLSGLPLEYFDAAVLRILGDKLGKMVRVDGMTLLGSRGNYARLCIEVDLNKPLVSKYLLNRRVRRVEYEGLHEICFHCGRYGHERGSCPLTREAADPSMGETLFSNPIFHEDNVRPELEGDFGPWMKAKKNMRRRKPPSNPKISVSEGGDIRTNSRFAVLEEEQKESNELIGSEGEGSEMREDQEVAIAMQVQHDTTKPKKSGRKLEFPEIYDPTSTHTGALSGIDGDAGSKLRESVLEQEAMIEKPTGVDGSDKLAS
ncbi:Uncharacterized protein At4g02000 [Linum perenne]